MNKKKYTKTKYPNIYKHIDNNTYAIDINLGYDIYGKRIRTTKTGIRTEKEAKKILADEKEKVILKKKITDKNKLNDLYDKYLYHCENVERLSYNTIKKKKLVFPKYILPILGHYYINDITKKEIILWHKELDKLELKDRTKNDIHTILNAFFNWCLKEDIIVKNPMFGIANYKLQKKEMQYWTYQEWKKFIDYIDLEFKKENTHKAILSATISRLLFFGGFRIGELMAITIKDINFNENYIDINKALIFEKGKGYIISNTKTFASNRQLYFSSELLNYLKLYIEYVEKHFNVTFENDDFIFLNPNTLKIYGEETIRKHLNYYMNKTNVKHIRLHDFRHSHVALLMSDDWELYHIKERLGHSRINITSDRYGHLDKNSKLKVANSMDKYL